MPITRLTIAHLDAIRAIAQRSFPVVWTDKDFAYFLAHECGYNYGMAAGTALQAYVIGLLVQKELDIVSLATAEAFRRQGLGKTLLENAKSDPGISRITLEVESTNQPALALYSSCGLLQTGIRKKYYQGKGDAIQMAWDKA